MYSWTLLSHQFSFGGYGLRHDSIFGIGTHPTGYPNNTDENVSSIKNSVLNLYLQGDGPTSSTDEENVMIINYADGPGYEDMGSFV